VSCALFWTMSAPKAAPPASTPGPSHPAASAPASAAPTAQPPSAAGANQLQCQSVAQQQQQQQQQQMPSSVGICARRSPWGHVPPTDAARTSAAIDQLDADVRKQLRGMTVEEKVGQMVQLNIDEILADDWRKDPESPKIDLTKLRRVTTAPHFVGSFLNSPFSGASHLVGKDGNSSYSSMSARSFRTMITTIQRTVMEPAGSGIPMLFGLDSVHGANYVREGTLFPQQINQAATFNRTATQQAAAIAAKDTKAAGIPWLFAPILGIATKPGWSRVYETFGEDPLLAAELGAAVVKGMQSGPHGTSKLSDPTCAAACIKHFIGYPNQEISHDRTPNTIPDRQMLEYFAPPFRAAIRAGAASMMSSYGSINGVPVTGNRAILTELLRDELNFSKLLVSDSLDAVSGLVAQPAFRADSRDSCALVMSWGGR
jgi:beta-glucosidase